MKKYIPLLMLVATVAILFVILFTCSSNSSLGNQRYTTMVIDILKYEEGIVKIGRREYDNEVAYFNVDSLDKEINFVAKQGWELVDVTPVTGCYYGSQIGTFRPVTQKLIYTFRKR